MIRKTFEKINIFIAKSPQKAVLVGIMLFNAVFFMIAAGIIAVLSANISGLKKCTFWESVYYTITMVLDAGCIDNVIKDVGKAGAFAAIVCILVVVIGMVFFTGAVIGYITNIISDFIDSNNNGKNKLIISNHIVIINWNSRAAEIINEFLYEKKEVKIVVFVPDNRKTIDEEIRNRLDTTIIRETEIAYKNAVGMPSHKRKKYLRKNVLKDNITYIVREGDVAAATDLDDICISKAKTVIILDNNSDEKKSELVSEIGNTQTVKTLIQVSEISKGNSRQMILVEVSDPWTEDLVYRIIDFKKDEGKETIIPISYNRLLGKTYSQIALMPELCDVYANLFSSKGAHFISHGISKELEDNKYIEKCLYSNYNSIPLTVTETEKGRKAFFMASGYEDIEESDDYTDSNRSLTERKVKIRKEIYFRKRGIVLFGHNSNMDSLLKGIDMFRQEQNLICGSETIEVLLVDEDENLKKYNYYKEYPFAEVLPIDTYDDELLDRKSIELSKDAPEDITMMILSDDQAGSEDADAYVLTYLIYIQEQLRLREIRDPGFKREKIDLIAEIRNLKNADIVKSYGADRVVISNRYLSHTITQISLGEAIYDFYKDILSYVSDGIKESSTDRQDKEISIIAAGDFFEEIPGKCTAAEMIRMIYFSSRLENNYMILGYIRNKKECIFFTGDQREIEISFEPEDKLILFGNYSNGHRCN